MYLYIFLIGLFQDFSVRCQGSQRLSLIELALFGKVIDLTIDLRKLYKKNNCLDHRLWPPTQSIFEDEGEATCQLFQRVH